MEWYKFEIAAYRQATQGLNCREHGIYRHLLDLYYTLEGPLLNDLRWLKQELKCGDRWDHQALIKVLSTYFILDASTNHYHNKRADEELSDYQERKIKNTANAHARWNGANRNANGNATAMPIQTDIHINKQKPVDNFQNRSHLEACGFLLENGQKCGEQGSLKAVGIWYCSQHKPYQSQRS